MPAAFIGFAVAVAIFDITAQVVLAFIVGLIVTLTLGLAS